MKNDKEQPMSIQEFSEELFDQYGYYIDDNLSGMEMVAGSDVILKKDFMLACADISNWQASQHRYTEQKISQAFDEVCHVLRPEFSDSQINVIKNILLNQLNDISNLPDTPPTYTQEQMIAFEEVVNGLKSQLNNQEKHKQSIKQYWLSCSENKKKWEDAVKEYFDSEHTESIQSFDDFKEQFDLY